MKLKQKIISKVLTLTLAFVAVGATTINANTI